MRKTPWQPERLSHPKRITIYDTEEGVELARAIARRRGGGLGPAFRAIIREEAARLGLLVPPPAEKRERIP